MNNFYLPDLSSILGSFFFVLLLLSVALYLLKKFQNTKGGYGNSRLIKIQEVFPMSHRQKIILLKVEKQQILISVSGQQINSLGQWPVENLKTNENKSLDSLKNLRPSDGNQAVTNFNKIYENAKKTTQTQNISHEKKIVNEFNNNFTEMEKTNHLLVLANKVRGSLKNCVQKAEL